LLRNLKDVFGRLSPRVNAFERDEETLTEEGLTGDTRSLVGKWHRAYNPERTEAHDG
jgi:hypothetical protein